MIRSLPIFALEQTRRRSEVQLELQQLQTALVDRRAHMDIILPGFYGAARATCVGALVAGPFLEPLERIRNVRMRPQMAVPVPGVQPR